ncbi:hypothetical protein KIPB_001396 [Kipferlia bialata]|uniref:Uncharacterized protein n=1 Tax=Kipferlia bialata TaxID=797122 RepID=A0A9K3CQ69_9EUKA|nr:hypothetical protein KIPB_001396 [Kipferlia bialata]|eukprot:g1396.t1
MGGVIGRIAHAVGTGGATFATSRGVTRDTAIEIRRRALKRLCGQVQAKIDALKDEWEADHPGEDMTADEEEAIRSTALDTLLVAADSVLRKAERKETLWGKISRFFKQVTHYGTDRLSELRQHYEAIVREVQNTDLAPETLLDDQLALTNTVEAAYARPPPVVTEERAPGVGFWDSVRVFFETGFEWVRDNLSPAAIAGSLTIASMALPYPANYVASGAAVALSLVTTIRCMLWGPLDEECAETQ